ncbi:YeeE/YedE family protein [Jiella sonneratiae]|uniref:YeeE/YedE family protein n=1 Tax=Jiella sonneratiae TaxID=2816856 RepID=A0ABS3J152_9HYPH|nr:YeeE/YedE thiosulfate transporter family protein [Jiella sonneratiae]MBO0903387.1 YeeE/YedE family protein [Jiella sonneratiae]
MPLDTITPFTPLASTLGGIMIGLSAVMVMALFGRIAGISGITTGALPARRDDWSWRLAFVLGLIAAPLLVLAVTGAPVAQTVSGNLVAMALAGLLVGFGTVTGSGCTSGHGVCGLARLSARSLVAVLTFMATAFVAVLVLRHLL